MTPAQIREARATLGKMWGLNRPLRCAEFARALRLRGRDPGQTVLRWERGSPISGPASVAVEMMLAGHKPPTIDDVRIPPASDAPFNVDEWRRCTKEVSIQTDKTGEEG